MTYKVRSHPLEGAGSNVDTEGLYTTCEGVQKKAAVTFELGLGEYLGIYILWEEGLQSLLIFRGDLKISSQLRI